LIPVSPLLIFGLGRFPASRYRRRRHRVLLYYVIGAAVFASTSGRVAAC